MGRRHSGLTVSPSWGMIKPPPLANDGPSRPSPHLRAIVPLQEQGLCWTSSAPLTRLLLAWVHCGQGPARWIGWARPEGPDAGVELFKHGGRDTRDVPVLHFFSQVHEWRHQEILEGRGWCGVRLGVALPGLEASILAPVLHTPPNPDPRLNPSTG